MSLLEEDVVLVGTTEEGNAKVALPYTRVNNVEGIGRSFNTYYSVGDVVYVDSNLSVALKCTTDGTTSADEIDISAKNIGDTVTDGSVVWQVCNRISDVTSVNGKTGDVVVDLPVGFMYFSLEKTVPAGRLPALGATYNRALYADLWAWANERGLVKSESEWQAIASANNGNCAYYSSGDGSTTFRVPKLPTSIVGDVPSEVPVVGNGMTLGLFGNFGMSSDSQANIYGISTAYGTSAGSTDPTGTLLKSTTVGITTDDTKSGIVAKMTSTKITGRWLIVAFGVAHNIGETDVANVMQAVEQVQTSVGTLEQGVGTAVDYIVESYRNGTEWYEVYKSGKVRQGGKISSSTVTYLKAFKDTNYTITTNLGSNSTNGFWASYFPYEKQPTYFKCTYDTHAVRDWIAEGQGA